MDHIILIGFMGAGKTAVGKRLARQMDLTFVDTDDMIEEQQGRSISDIFAKNGEAYFRSLETEVLCQLLDSKERCVISVGGGLPVQKQNWSVLRELGTVVYLEAEIDTLLSRLKYDTKRPKLQGGNLKEKIETLMEQRKDIYVKTADLRVSTDNREFHQILQEIMEKTAGYCKM